MTQVVQARCPHCQNVLRIPAEWLNRSMRCKFCKNVFEARAKAGDTPLPPTTAISAAPVARAAATAVTARAPARAAAPMPVIAPTPRRRGGSGKLFALAGCAVLFLVLSVPAAIFGLIWSGVVTTDLFIPDQLPAVVAVRDKAHASTKDHDARDHAQKDGRPLNPKPKVGTTPDTTAGKDRDRKPPRKDKTPGPKASNLLPRRALLISVDNYLYLNTVDHGKQRVSLGGLADFVLSNPPMKIPTSQIFKLSDDGANPHPTELSVIKNAIKDFLDTSRAQDRILILFAGHATDVEKDSYLIPIGGRQDNVDTMLPLKWVYDQLAACKARQKVLILDVFHYAPARGFELPGAGASDEGEMGEEFDKNLQEPPAGVQVWSSCVKGQRAIEFEGGSVFLQAMDQTLRNGPAMGFVEGPAPLPIDGPFVDKVNKKIKELMGAEKYEQTSRLSGTPPANGAAYDPKEPQALPITLKQPVTSGQSASFTEVNGVLDEIRLLPAVRKTRAGGEDRLLKAVNLPPFSAEVLNKYKPDDYKSVAEVLARYKKDPKALAKTHPVREAVLEAIDALKKSDHIVMRESLDGPITPKKKTDFLAEQTEPGVTIFELEKALGKMRTVAADDLEKEPSKRWQANFEFTMARLEGRLVYIYEYSYLLGQVRQDALPPVEGTDGWRVGSRKKIQVTEPKAKRFAKEMASAWRNIQKRYPGTPWSVLAYRESLVALGLEWRVRKE